MTDSGAAAPEPDRSARNELSGTVIGPSVQAGTIHGDVHLHGIPEPPPPVPRQLPPAPAHFTGRDAELAALDDLLGPPSTAGTVAVLSGTGGIGKTALALRWAHRVRDRFPDGQLYVDLAGFSGGRPVEPAAALGGFLRALGVPPGRVPVDPGEQAGLFRSLAADRSLLVVLDNVYSAAQARALLPASARSAVLVTSRHRLTGLAPDGARLIDVGPLTDDAAGTLLARIAGPQRIDRESDRARDLVGMCAGLPIAVCVSAARLAARPRLSVGRLADEMADEARRIGALSTSDGGSVRAVFDTSYLALDEPAARLYRGLAWHPGPEFGTGPATALVAGDPPGPGDPLDRLVEARLLEEVEEDRFRFHDLVRLHARDRAGSGERAAATRTVAEWYLAAARTITPYRDVLPYRFVTAPADPPAPADREDALGWLDRERVNLMAAGAAALEHGWPELAWQLSDVIWPLLLYRKHYRDRLEIDRRGVAAARTWGNPRAEAEMLRRLGGVTTTLGDHPAAEEHLRRSIDLATGLGDAPGVAYGRDLLGVLYLDSDRAEAAADTFRRVLADRRQLGADREVGLTLINLGRALLATGRPAEALARLREAQAIFTGLAGTDPYNGARILVGLARGYLDSGDSARAGGTAAEAARSMRALGSEVGEADAIEVLGDVARQHGDHRAALRHYREALRVFSAVGSSKAARLRGRIDELAGPGTRATGTDPPP
jgi:tetratricopeptide (TPR) repeat protein